MRFQTFLSKKEEKEAESQTKKEEQIDSCITNCSNVPAKNGGKEVGKLTEFDLLRPFVSKQPLMARWFLCSWAVVLIVQLAHRPSGPAESCPWA